MKKMLIENYLKKRIQSISEAYMPVNFEEIAAKLDRHMDSARSNAEIAGPGVRLHKEYRFI